MSKIGKNPIQLPDSTSVSLDTSSVTVTGPKGTKVVMLYPGITVSKEDNTLTVHCQDIELSSHWGTMRSLLFNAVEGVTQGYTQKLQVIGVGFDASLQGSTINLKLGYAHPVLYKLPEGITAVIEKDPKGNAIITLTSHDKQLIGQTAAQLRALKKPEPYKGKGIRYFNEVVKLKAGKAAKK